jgi:hypothetical protein
MSTYFRALDTNEGVIHILTKSRWLGLIHMPRTSVMPHRAAELKRLGTLIRWRPVDTETLAALHETIVRLVEENGGSGLIEIRNSVMMTERIAHTVGADWRDIIEQATQGGVSFPLSKEILKYVKGFV